MNCIIIEDEPAARSILESHISKCPSLRLHAAFADAFSAQEFLIKNRIDLIFLDINLPEMSGISFLRSLVHPPLVIFTTAYSKYAVDGFDLEVVDFLLKPFSFERFYRAVNKALEKFNAPEKAPSPSRITVKSGKKIYQLALQDILTIETCGDYVTLQCTDKKLVVHGTLKSWEERLKGVGFLKVHRTALVNLAKIEHLEGNMVQIGGQKLPVSEPFRESLVAQMTGETE